MYSGCCDKISQTGGLINNRNLFLSFLEAGKSKVKFAADPVSAKGRLFRVSGIRALISFITALPS